MKEALIPASFLKSSPSGRRHPIIALMSVVTQLLNAMACGQAESHKPQQHTILCTI